MSFSQAIAGALGSQSGIGGLIKDVPKLGDVVKAADDKLLVKDLEVLFKQARNDRLQYERQWQLNMAFYLDQQWVFYNEVSRKLEKPRVPKWRVLMVVNYVKGIVRTEYAKLVQQRPEAKTQPASSDPDDENQARVCDALLDYLVSVDGSVKAEKRALLWAILTGTGILHSCWDKVAGEPLTYPRTTMEQVVDPATGQATPQEVPHPQAGELVLDQNGDAVHIGEIETREISPFEFVPDPFGLTIEQKSYVFLTQMRSSEYVMDKFGVDVESKSLSTDQFFDGQLSRLMGEVAQDRKGVIVKSFWQRSTKKYPKGRYIIYVDEKILYQGENPYPKCQLPFTAFVHIPVPGRFWGDSMVTSLIDPQKNMNKSRSQSVEHRNLLLKGKWIVYKNALDVDKTITSAPGEIIEVNPVPNVSRPVELIPGTPIPESFWKDQEHTVSEMREISGVHDVSMSGVPGGVHAAAAIRFLQEQDDLRLGPTAQSYEDAISEISEIKLRLAKQFYEEPRTVRVVGDNDQVKVQEFYKDDIPDNVDVHVQTGSSLPKSRIARQHFVMELVQNKMIPPGREALKLLELGEVEGLYDEVNLDINQAERENDKMEHGDQQVVVEHWHNHPVHIVEHNKKRKRQEFERFDPAIQYSWDAHVTQHEQFAAQQAAQAAAVDPSAVLGAAAGNGGVVGQGSPQSQPPDLLASHNPAAESHTATALTQ